MYLLIKNFVLILKRKANVTPKYKKGDKSLASNYRPISQTCILCKVLEHILAYNIVRHLDGQGLMYSLQHGFREKRSCETQLIMLVEDLARNAGLGKQTDFILLDFSMAFNKVNHSKLIWKLHNYGIRSSVLNWIVAFLGDRAQKVVVGGRGIGYGPCYIRNTAGVRPRTDPVPCLHQ